MRQLPDWVPPTVKVRANAMGYDSVRKLERAADLSNGYLEKMYKRGSSDSIEGMLRLLSALGYECKAPEFDIIKGFLVEKPLQDVRRSSTISNVKTQENFYLCLAKNTQILEIPHRRLKAS